MDGIRAELQALLGGGISKTKLTATEDKPTTTTVDTAYMCEYGSNGNNPFALDVSGSNSQDGFTPKAAIDAIAKAAKATTHSVTGVGMVCGCPQAPKHCSGACGPRLTQRIPSRLRLPRQGWRAER
jgi:hypothetical protein